MARACTPKTPFYRFNSSPEVIRLVVLMYVRFPLSLRNVEDLLFERGIDISYGTVRFWWNRFGPMFAAEIRSKRSAQMPSHPVALAPRRGLREDQWRAALPLASGRS
jgi:transposase-like protein